MKLDKNIVFIGMGFELVGLILSALWLGDVLDKYWDLKGKATLFMILFAMVSWFYHTIVLLKKVSK